MFLVIAYIANPVKYHPCKFLSNVILLRPAVQRPAVHLFV